MEWNIYVVFPDVGTHVCPTEMGAFWEWKPRFADIGVNIQLVTAQTEELARKDIEESDILEDDLEVNCSEEFVEFLGLETKMDADKPYLIAERATVFLNSITGEKKVWQHFDEVGRSFKEIYRTIGGKLTGDYCGAEFDFESDNIETTIINGEGVKTNA